MNPPGLSRHLSSRPPPSMRLLMLVGSITMRFDSDDCAGPLLVTVTA
jgi:hypothetical protein